MSEGKRDRLQVSKIMTSGRSRFTCVDHELDWRWKEREEASTNEEGKKGDMRMIKRECGRKKKNAGLEEGNEK